ncbi:MAG: hypothetical protein Q7T55_15555, partial [Solirubrobacteraceae bacterium]|nr:hypothetical protein [Solirubrobacteraceae bacterium]
MSGDPRIQAPAHLADGDDAVDPVTGHAAEAIPGLTAISGDRSTTSETLLAAQNWSPHTMYGRLAAKATDRIPGPRHLRAHHGLHRTRPQAALR